MPGPTPSPGRGSFAHALCLRVHGRAERAHPQLLVRLEEVVGTPHLLVDPDVVATFALDWTGRFGGHPGRGATGLDGRSRRGGLALP